MRADSRNTMTSTVSKFHERLLLKARSAALQPFAKFIDGEAIDALKPAQIGSGFLLTTVAISFALTMLGLEDYAAFGFFTSWFLWNLHSLVGLLPLTGFTRILRLAGLSPFLASIAALILTYPLLALGSIGIDELFSLSDPDDIGSTSFLQNIISEAGEVFAVAFVVWAVVAAFIFSKTVNLKTGEADRWNSRTGESVWPKYLAEVHESKRGEIIGLTADQHYLKVETTSGESYIRGSLTDAISSLYELPGLQIHRSHWVARNQVKRLIENDGVLYCETCTGSRYPISRRRRKQTRSALQAI
jgi:hypothetical protein